MRAVFALLLVVAAVMVGSNAQDEPMQCGPHSVYTECMSACEPKCNVPRPPICSRQCVKGCRCVQGFLLGNNNECVESSTCSQH